MSLESCPVRNHREAWTFSDECAAIMEVMKITKAVELELGSAGATLNNFVRVIVEVEVEISGRVRVSVGVGVEEWKWKWKWKCEVEV